MHEECGICGVSGPDAEKKLYKMLIQLQHRGQLSAGVTTFHPNDARLLKTYKGLGLVNSVFRTEDEEAFNKVLGGMTSTLGIGHVRYATSGLDDVGYAQPFERPHGRKAKWFSICFNGNIANYQELKKDLEESGYNMIHDTDTELIMHLLSKQFNEHGEDWKTIFSNLSKILDGAYSLCLLNANGTLVVARDILGIKPLAYATRGEEFAFASESIALDGIGFENIHDVPPGSILILENNTLRVEKYAESPKKAHCFFEWVYFAHPVSKPEGSLVYSARYDLGKILGAKETVPIDKECIVVPVPDSASPAGDGFAESVGAPIKEALIRNRFIGRTFIQSKSRGEKVKEKFSIAKDIVRGKKIFLIDDSIVRGTTLKNIIQYIREVGAPKEIHVRITCPPILWPCFYGIDMGSRKELVAVQNDGTIETIGKYLGVDSLRYQTEEDMITALKIPKGNLCTACISGKYPTKKGQELSEYSGDGRAVACHC